MLLRLSKTEAIVLATLLKGLLTRLRVGACKTRRTIQVRWIRRSISQQARPRRAFSKKLSDRVVFHVLSVAMDLIVICSVTIGTDIDVAGTQDVTTGNSEANSAPSTETASSGTSTAPTNILNIQGSWSWMIKGLPPARRRSFLNYKKKNGRPQHAHNIVDADAASLPIPANPKRLLVSDVIFI